MKWKPRRVAADDWWRITHTAGRSPRFPGVQILSKQSAARRPCYRPIPPENRGVRYGFAIDRMGRPRRDLAEARLVLADRHRFHRCLRHDRRGVSAKRTGGLP